MNLIQSSSIGLLFQVLDLTPPKSVIEKTATMIIPKSMNFELRFLHERRQFRLSWTKSLVQPLEALGDETLPASRAL